MKTTLLNNYFKIILQINDNNVENNHGKNVHHSKFKIVILNQTNCYINQGYNDQTKWPYNINAI